MCLILLRPLNIVTKDVHYIGHKYVDFAKMSKLMKILSILWTIYTVKLTFS